MIAGHAALLAWKSGRPVKMIYGRSEDMAATTKRHPSRTRHRTAVDARRTAARRWTSTSSIDGGAYCTLSPVVLSRGTIHAAGPYSCPNVRVRGRAVATNVPPHGAFRGFGAPQSIFALERHMDKVAAAVGALARGIPAPQLHHAGRHARRRADDPRAGRHARAARSRAGAVATTSEKRERFARENPRRRVEKGHRLRVVHARRRLHRIRRGAPASVVDGRRHAPKARCACWPRAPRSARGPTRSFRRSPPTRSASTATTSTSSSPTPSRCPNSGPTVASRTCMVVGKLVETAALGVKHALDRRRLSAGRVHREPSSQPRASATSTPSARCAATSQYQPPPGLHWDDEKYMGDAYGTYAWAVYVAEVTVDLDHVGDARRRLRRRSGSRQGDQPDARGGPDRRRRRAGHRLGALRGRRLARGPDGQRADDQLHHADVDGPAADPRRTSRRSRIRTGQRARRASASCRWTARRRRSSTRSRTPPAREPTQLPLTPERLMAADGGESVSEARSRRVCRAP